MDNKIAELHIKHDDNNYDNYEIVDANARYVITEINKIFQQNINTLSTQLSYLETRLSNVESLLQQTLTYLENK